jgi:hypothetical protein
MDATTQDQNSWASWFQGVAGNVIGKAADATYVRPYDIQALRLQALGSEGYYTEGQPGTAPAAQGMTSTTVLMLGGALLLAVVLLKD